MDLTPRRSIAACVLVLALLGAAGAARAGSIHDRLHDARTRADTARADERALAAAVTQDSARIDALEREVATVSAEVAGLEARLSEAKAALAAATRLLERKTFELERARSQAKIAQRVLAERVVAIYTSEEPGAVDILLGATSIEGAMEALDSHDRLLEYDRGVLTDVRRLRAKVAQERARVAALREARRTRTREIAQRTAARRTALATVTARRDEIVSLRDRRRRALASVRVDRRSWEAQADALEAESAQLRSAVTAAAPVSAASTTVSAPATTGASASGFIWPASGSVVSPFGQRWGRLHAGIDIAAPAGTAVVASASGQVTYAGSMSGYGLIVVIQHAGGISTAYAHNSRIAVSTGQSVSQGQGIAAVGCTGHCFGDHVHFEVRVNGSPVDPMGYL